MRTTRISSLVLALLLAPRLAAAGEIVVSTSSELAAALAPENAGRTIRVRAGNYVVSQPLVVPDGATVIGEGEMLRDGEGRPAGLAADARTTLRASAALEGDLVTLGHGSTIDHLLIEDVPVRRTGGNVVVVWSRAPGDVVTATILDCELVATGQSAAAPNGPIGRGLLVATRKPQLPPGPPHDGARVSVTMTGSIVRSPRGGSGVFAINFASSAAVSVVLDGDVIGGGLDAAGGVSRPVQVTDSTTTIVSRGNLYRSDNVGNAPAFIGWSLNGGSGPPFVVPGLEIPPTERNHLDVRSTDDRIEGFMVGIYAVGAKRFYGSAGPSNQNRTDLDLSGTRIHGLAASFWLFGAESVTDPALSPGSGNVLHVRASGVVAGGGDDLFADAMGPLGPLPPELAGDNRLEIEGDL